MLSMSVRSIMHFLYPPLLALHDLAEDAGLPDPTTGRIVLPDIMHDSHLYMEAHGVYLIDNGETMIMWIGGSVSPQLLLDLFGMDDLIALDAQMSELPRLQTKLSTQVNNILELPTTTLCPLPHSYVGRSELRARCLCQLRVVMKRRAAR
ncbi:hypothetical protein B0H14DRAFT_1534150 [Mycena olivaceomarginata]|nr:hypothetical protein B0H14DRAFT_1534150 [Mycena olivaceomarginata]